MTDPIKAIRKQKQVRGREHGRYRHGMAGTRIYNIWCNMKARCENPKEICYPRYGGRGIKVCRAWQNFQGFYGDMADSYRDDLTIERLDNNKGYTKENCTWIPRFYQGRNRRSVKKYDYKGKDYYLSELAEMAGIKHRTMYARLYIYQWPVQKAVETPYGYKSKN